MSRVHYKFFSKLNYDTVTFDGLYISLRDLKLQIMGREKLTAASCDLQITNAQTKEGAWGQQARGLGDWPAGGVADDHGLREPRSALCGSSPRSMSQAGGHPASMREDREGKHRQG
ncbi:uncharacterized protein ACIBXB_005641 [Morphnus guianensis]